MNALAILQIVTSLAMGPVVGNLPAYTITDLALGSGFEDAFAYGTSPNGKITGVGWVTATGELHAYIRETGGTYQDLGLMGYPYRTDGIAINNSGQVAATGYGPGCHALLWSGGHAKKLGSLDGGNSEGLAINSQGAIAGNIQTYSGGQVGAFLYINGTLVNLADLLGPAGAPWSQLTVTQMNDAGWIVGYGTINGGTHGFLIRPSAPIAPRPRR